MIGHQRNRCACFRFFMSERLVVIMVRMVNIVIMVNLWFNKFVTAALL